MRTVAKILLLLILLFLGFIILKNCNSGWCLKFPGQRERAASDFKSCVEFGFPIADTAPRECRAGTKTYTENLPQNQETPLEVERNIKIMSPQPDQKIGLPIVITGEARVFENQIAYRLTDDEKNTLAEGFSIADAPDIGQYGPFEIIIARFTNPKTNKGIISVFSHSPRDGQEINKVDIPVIFLTENTQVIKVFFGQSSNNSSDICTETLPVERRIAKSAKPYQVALEELISGPTVTEKRQGLFSNVKNNTKLNNVSVSGGVITADFSEELDDGVAGSCTVTLIRAQITNTLKQFANIDEVVISVKGDSEEALQP